MCKISRYLCPSTPTLSLYLISPMPSYGLCLVRAASFFFPGTHLVLGTILGRFSINYFRGLGLRI